MSTTKIKPILGDDPGYGADWWTKEQWDEHYAYIEKLKKEGKYLTEGEEVTITIQDYPMFENQKPFSDSIKNFGLLVPKGDNEKPPTIKY